MFFKGVRVPAGDIFVLVLVVVCVGIVTVAAMRSRREP